MESLPDFNITVIMDSLSDGVYVCDRDRRITYWNKSAERITGWRAEDIVGRKCSDDVLCHIDKDGHELCGEEYCPLHRAMVTGTRSGAALLVYGQGRSGERIPMQVTVAPIRNDAGEVVGGVETFRDASAVVHDLERAKAIQQLALQYEVPEDPRVQITTHYIPHEIVGGDYYAVKRLDPDRYGLVLADVMGHGVAAALYTVHLSSLSDRYGSLLVSPEEFAGKMNNGVVRVVKEDESFATAVCGLVDLESRVFRFAGAGGPQVVLTHPDGTYECLEASGLPLGIMEDAPYQAVSVDIEPGDCLLMFSDGAIEVQNVEREVLGIDGLVGLLRAQGYPDSGIDMGALEKELLKYSNAIRLEDDLTFVEVRFAER